MKYGISNASSPSFVLGILQRRILASLIFRHHLIAEVWDRFPNGVFVMERSLFSAASLFAEVNSRLRPHPGWVGVKELIIRSFEKFYWGKVIAIALRLPFEETVRRSLARGDPDINACLLYTSPSPRDRQKSRMPSSA